MRGCTIILIFLFILGYGCESDAPPADTATETVSRIPSDSLRQLYRQYRSMQTDTLPAKQVQERHKLYPVDEAPMDTAFFVFREQLLQAVQQRDVFALLDAVDKDIKVSGAKEPGVAGLVSRYGLTPTAADSLPIWPILEELLKAGGTFSDNGQAFTAPYYAATWPEALPKNKYAAITGSGVRIRSAPNLSSDIVKTISYELVQYLETTNQTEVIGGETHPWCRIELSGGKVGFVYGKFVARPTGYRAQFEKTGPQQWAMTQLIYGE
ncbi:SH3 domain-containing protein [Phaeodactylibacter sp.]|uniref:SH3 domain-containing protein n=1 Tax=Phaeodactylibacter sp. TaxID=1940289 RepID=UPI0025DB6E36|nr:SH3 domain-containing protein [Phaeodactylibacter sp.]MCI4651360.1 SH3 domain-containing protein [Phaeodactylibacter sp.]MCI5093567.1 SH3 domain-containing protein [Phaeodactylibacter sp.]